MPSQRGGKTFLRSQGLRGLFCLSRSGYPVIRQESEKVEKTLKELVKPSEIGLKVKRLTMIRNGVILEAESEEVVDKFVKNEALQRAGVEVETPNLKKPVVMIYDFKLRDEEVFGWNMVESGIPKEEFLKEFEVKHRLRYKD